MIIVWHEYLHTLSNPVQTSLSAYGNQASWLSCAMFKEFKTEAWNIVNVVSPKFHILFKWAIVKITKDIYA